MPPPPTPPFPDFFFQWAGPEKLGYKHAFQLYSYSLRPFSKAIHRFRPPSLYRVNIFFSFSNLGCSLHGEMSKIVEPAPLNGNRVNKELIPLQYKHISNSKIIHNLCTNYKLFKARIQRFLNQSRVVYLFWESYFPPPLPLLELYFFSKVHDLKQVYFTGPAETSGGGVQRRPLLSFFFGF